MKFLIPFPKSYMEGGSDLLLLKVIEELATLGDEFTILTVDGHTMDWGSTVEMVRMPRVEVEDPLLTETEKNGVAMCRTLERNMHSLGNIGLPSDRAHFDAIIGQGVTSSREAHYIKENFYAEALSVDFLHIDPMMLDFVQKRVFRDSPNDLFQHIFSRRSNLVVGSGPLAAAIGREFTKGADGLSMTSTHEMIPGIREPKELGALPPIECPFILLQPARTDDPNKGAREVAMAVREVRSKFIDVRLILLGDKEDAGRAQAEYDREFGKGVVTVHSFTTDPQYIHKIICSSHAAVAATESEAYGMASPDYAIYGRPILLFPGHQNGFAALLRDEHRFPERFANAFIFDDRGSRSLRGDIMGAWPKDVVANASQKGDLDDRGWGRKRHEVIADGIMRMVGDYERHLHVAEDLRRFLKGYTTAYSATAFRAAVERARSPGIVHTRQIARGSLVELGPAELEADRKRYARHIKPPVSTYRRRHAAEVAQVGFPLKVPVQPISTDGSSARPAKAPPTQGPSLEV